jgi:UTP-glucose-1-phosphate uridylyltransferase
MMRLDEDRLLDESMRLSRELDRALQRDPLLLRHIPNSAKIVLVSESMPELTAYALAQAERAAKPNEPVYFVLVDQLMNDKSRAS